MNVFVPSVAIKRSVGCLEGEMLHAKIVVLRIHVVTIRTDLYQKFEHY